MAVNPFGELPVRPEAVLLPSEIERTHVGTHIV